MKHPGETRPKKVPQMLSVRGRSDVIYTDSSKAFVRVDHGILLLKFLLIGISDTIHRWMGSYLSPLGRSFFLRGRNCAHLCD